MSTRVSSRTTSKIIVASVIMAGAAALALITVPKNDTVQIAGTTPPKVTAPVVNAIDPLIITKIDNGLTHPEAPIFRQVSVGLSAACVLKLDGTVWCWGKNDWGQLGVPSTVLMYSPTPVQVMVNGAPLTNVKQISVGKWSNIGKACALKNDGTVWCWGRAVDQRNINNYTIGAPPNLTTNSQPIQMQMSPNDVPITHVVKFDASRNNCFIKDDQSAWCFGVDRLGDQMDVKNYYTKSAYPVRIKDANGVAINNAVDIQSGYTSTCIITSNNNPIRCWGDGGDAQLGDLTRPLRISHPINYVIDNLQQQNNPFFGAVKLAVGDYHTCVLDKFGSVACWGMCDLDKLDAFRLFNFNPGKPVCNLDATYFPGGNGKVFKNITDIGSGDVYTCVLKEFGTVWCWGSDLYMQLGDGQQVNSWTAPVQANVQGQPLQGFRQISVGEGTVCGLWENKLVACWGNNGAYQVGSSCNLINCPPTIISF